MKNIKRQIPALTYTLFLTVLVLYPYLVKDFLAIEHDTFFHLSRIENLSISIRNGDFFPALYPFENNGFGYASPLFYSDFFLIVPALLHIASLSLINAYKLAVFCATLIGAIGMLKLSFAMTQDQNASMVSTAAFMFSNYHITDIFVRGALGEIFALAALPFVLLAMHRILVEKKKEHWFYLTLSLSALALCHNLTFLMGCIACLVLFIIHIKSVTPDIFESLAKGAIWAMALTLFFTFPMIEQMRTQKLIVSYYNQTQRLSTFSMDLWQYFANKTVFGIAGNYLDRDKTMLENIGYFLTFAPWFYFLAKKKDKAILAYLGIGVACMIMPSSILPWEHMAFLGIMQFPWRFNTLAIVFLSIPAGMAVSEICRDRSIAMAVIVLLGIECIYHVEPAMSRTFGMTSEMTWQQVLDGELINPYYSASYMRVELAGGDYLPAASPDFRAYPPIAKDGEGNIVPVELTKNNTVLMVDIDQDYETIVLPLTWYKGYRMYKVEGTSFIPIQVTRSKNALVSFSPNGAGRYMAMYLDTPLRRICKWLSTLAATFLFLYWARNRKN